jgi:acetyl-CoA carboxylase biotin carboxylase subunit
MKKTIKKLLIANRGEIARRIQTTCQALGIKTVAIYAHEDRFLSYTCHADQAYKLPQDGAQGYLDQEAIVVIAKKSGADAIHPGYGFLAENGSFAQFVIDNGLTWVGPTPRNISLLADKAKAHKIMREAGIPTIPGKSFDSSDHKSRENAKYTALIIGFPALLKCAHGGGGKGMRLVKSIEEFDSAWDLVVSESKKLFSSHTIVVEKQIEKPRHIEVQIAGDGQEIIHMYERECSVQRRHQKIIEESPCCFINRQTKQKLYDAAIRAARAVNYQNIGTVEFLVDQHENFYFLEMNTRLQVEHSVTEITTKIDLVELQIQLASGKALPYFQDEIKQLGHAIECRIYSENPEQNFAPSTGEITNLILPKNPFLRIDHDLHEGVEITPNFDPMIAKFTSHGIHREKSIQNMISSLEKTNFFGIDTNVSFLKNILESDVFKSGLIHTQHKLNIKNTTKTIMEKNQEKLIDAIKTGIKNTNSQSDRPKSPRGPRPPSRWRNQRWG